MICTQLSLSPSSFLSSTYLPITKDEKIFTTQNICIFGLAGSFCLFFFFFGSLEKCTLIFSVPHEGPLKAVPNGENK